MALSFTVPTNLTVNGTTTTSSLAIGGNATATGYIIISGSSSLDGLSVSGVFGGSKRVYVGYNATGDYGFIASVDTGVGWKELWLNPLGGAVKVPSTSAATGAANTGALQSAGGIWAAGNIVTASTLFRSKSANGTTGSPVEDQIVGWTNTNGALQGAGLYALNSLSDNSAVWLRIKTLTTGGVATTALTIDSLQNVTLASTTSSSSTSTGALIVSGGLGLGGQLTGGGGAQIAGTPNMPAAWTGGYGIGLDGALVNRRIFFGDGSGYDLRFSTRAASVTTDLITISDTGSFRFNTNSVLPGVGSIGKSATYGLNFYAATGSSYDFAIFGAGGTAFMLNPTGTLNVIFGGSIQLGIAYAAGAPSPTGYLTFRDSTGTLYKVPAVAA